MGKVSIREKYGIDVEGFAYERETDEDRFNAACERYRSMMESIEGKSFEERKEAINNFRAGKL